jgi:choline monooxygenase
MRTLEGRYYSDPAVFSAERTRIFERSWQLVGYASQMTGAGDYLSTTVAGQNVFVIRGDDGTLRAFRNVCRHRGARLLDAGEGNCLQIKCRYHDWRYNIEGALVDTPWYGQQSPFDLESLSLYPIRVDVWRNLIFLAIDPEVELVEQLGDFPDNLANVPIEAFSVGATRIFTVPINWKIYIDQFCEAYHVPTTHSPDKAVDMQNYRTRPHRGMMLMETIGTTATAAASYYGGRWLWGWPNWTLSLFDGGMKISRLEPVSPTETVVQYHFLFADMSDDNAENRSRVVEATASIFWEDIAGCTLIQANHPSIGFHSGPLHPELEQAVAYFQGRVKAAVGNN